MERPTLRQRYHVVASLAYMVIGTILIVRSALAPAGIIGWVAGFVFLALGAVRIRDFRTWRRSTRDP